MFALPAKEEPGISFVYRGRGSRSVAVRMHALADDDMLELLGCRPGRQRELGDATGGLPRVSGT